MVGLLTFCEKLMYLRSQFGRAEYYSISSQESQRDYTTGQRKRNVPGYHD